MKCVPRPPGRTSSRGRGRQASDEILGPVSSSTNSIRSGKVFTSSVRRPSGRFPYACRMILLAASSMATVRQSTSDEGTPASSARNRTTHLKTCSSRASLLMTIRHERSAVGMNQEALHLGRSGLARSNSTCCKRCPATCSSTILPGSGWEINPANPARRTASALARVQPRLLVPPNAREPGPASCSRTPRGNRCSNTGRPR